MTQRERDALAALLAVEFERVETLRLQAVDVVVVDVCGCGCPSIDFERGRGLGMEIRVNAGVRGSRDGLFLYTVEDPHRGEVLGGIEWVSFEGTDPAELPSPELLDVRPA